MTIKYVLLNPADGQYEYFNTEELLKIKLAERALAFYISHGHGIAYNKVTIEDETGWETWESVNAVTLKADEELYVEAIKEQL
jgi:hypothetical protein